MVACSIKARGLAHNTSKEAYEMSWFGDVELAVRFSGSEAGTSSRTTVLSSAAACFSSLLGQFTPHTSCVVNTKRLVSEASAGYLVWTTFS